MVKHVAVTVEILRLLYRNMSNNPISIPYISRSLGISERTVYRYVDELTCCGIPIDKIRGCRGGIILYREKKA